MSDMDQDFTEHTASLRPQLQRLLATHPMPPLSLPAKHRVPGVYLLSELDRHLYVGRSNDIRARLGRHCRVGSTHRMGAFAFRLAREATGCITPTYTKGAGSRTGLMELPEFASAFAGAKARIREMNVRFVEERDPVRQCLLEIYVAVVLKTPYNDFDNH